MNYELTFLPIGIGSGDAIVIRYDAESGGSALHVVDGGRSDTSNTISEHIAKYYARMPIDHMVLTHADDDHATGLVGVMRRHLVRHLWMNRPWLYAQEIIGQFHGSYTLDGLIRNIKDRHPYLVELEELALEQGTQIHDVFQGAQIGAFHVLAPSRDRYVNSIHEFGKTPKSYATEAHDSNNFGLLKAIAAAVKKKLEDWDFETLSKHTETSASNESCVVQYATFGDRRILLTGDVGPVGLNEAGVYGEALALDRPNVVQVPHHGSRHNVTPAVLDMWLGSKKPPDTFHGWALCSVGSNKPEYPRPQVTNAFMRRGFRVYATRSGWIASVKGAGIPDNGVPAPESFAYEVETL